METIKNVCRCGICGGPMNRTGCFFQYRGNIVLSLTRSRLTQNWNKEETGRGQSLRDGGELL